MNTILFVGAGRVERRVNLRAHEQSVVVGHDTAMTAAPPLSAEVVP